jgi:putative ABC transport system permease protein
MALGATRADVLWNVIQRGGVLVVLGSALGMGASFAVTGELSQLLFQTGPVDPVIFAGAVALLGVIGIAACLLPAWRASQLDPRAALNTE